VAAGKRAAGAGGNRRHHVKQSGEDSRLVAEFAMQPKCKLAEQFRDHKLKLTY
jgi:hypothetical protein